MTKPFGSMRRLWRGVLLGAGCLGAIAACGDDDSPPEQALGPDAGPGSAGGSDQGGSGGGSAAGAAGTAGAAGNAGEAGAVTETCEPNTTRPCQQDFICSGEQTCASDGAGFGACDCGTTALVGSGAVGARCETDADCASGATCLAEATTQWRGVAGGPAGGYCSLPCTDNADCQALDSQSTCQSFAPAEGSYCIRGCLSKDPDAGEAKCLNRPDVACISVAAQGDPENPFMAERQVGYCGPRCGSNSDCSGGRFCHRSAGLCTTNIAPGGAIGSRCDADRDCDGNSCEDRDAEGIGTCTALCVLGALNGCGYAADVIRREAACLAPLVAAGRFTEGAGDIGLCRELCDVAEDCERAGEGWVCTPVGAELAEFVGRSGACAPPQ